MIDRRTLLHLASVFPSVTYLPSLARAGEGREWRADVVIIGAGVGGVAAALAVARLGRTAVLTEATDWIGGQLTSQAVPPDEHPWIEQFGCTRSYRHYRDGVRRFYREHYPVSSTARAAAIFNPGNGSVSRLCHEPRVSLAVLLEMLAPHLASQRIRLLTQCQPTRASMKGDRVEAVTVRHVSGVDYHLVGSYFLDATELGDLLPLTGCEFVTGSEAQKDTNEPHAPAEAQPANQQAFTVCFAVDYRPGEDHTIEKPSEYAFWRDYIPRLKPAWPGKLLAWSMSDPVTLKPRAVRFDPTGVAGTGLNLWLYRRILDGQNFTEGSGIGDVTLVNWPQNDYWLGNLVGVSAEEAARHEARARQLSRSLLYWMQTEAPRPDGGVGWKGLRLRGDVVDSTDGLAKAAYIRESRRIRAVFTVCEQHVSTEIRRQLTGKPPDELTAEPFADTVGIGSYRIDLHPTSGGDNYLDVSSLPFQIPLGALLPVRIENLLPACKNLGVTHITNGCFRLHPVEWNIGESAGTLAAHAVATRLSPRQIRAEKKHLAAFQQRLREQGIELTWPRPGPR